MSETSNEGVGKMDYNTLAPNQQNRFIYVKHNFLEQPPKVLLNPHFKKTVYLNPQFKPPAPTTIHINPNFVPKPLAKTAVISTRNKLIRVPLTPERKRRTSINSKYKIVRSNTSKLEKQEKPKVIKSPVKKKFVYVNRFLSYNEMAKSVLLKKSPTVSKSGFININGVLYKKSPNSLKKAVISTPNKFSKALNSSFKANSKYKLVRTVQKRTPTSSKTLVKRYKIVRPKKTPVSASKLRKCNIPCLIYRKYGKCPRKLSGKCFKLHNPDQIVLCTRFLQGACQDDNCLLSHKVSNEKMPTCKYFLEGMCFKDDCQYLHVKISPTADICRDFLEGFCRRGAECDKRHQLLCPDFERNKQCPKRRCRYPHSSTTVRKFLKSSSDKVVVAKKCSEKDKVEMQNERYYKERKISIGAGGVIGTVARDRPKLGDLPAFIPFC